MRMSEKRGRDTGRCRVGRVSVCRVRYRGGAAALPPEDFRVQAREESRVSVVWEAERREVMESKRLVWGEAGGASVTLAAPLTAVPTELRKDRDSKSAEAGVQVMTRVSVREGGTGRVSRACTVE